MSKQPFCSVIIVTYNSEHFIDKAFQCLNDQTRPADQILIIDSGSRDPTYLKPYTEDPRVKLVFAGQDVGFCRANNVGMRHLAADCDYVFFLNPDAFLFPNFLQEAVRFMERPLNQSCAMITGKTYGYDIENGLPTGRYDTTGIFQNWYGHWYDRGQGESCDTTHYDTKEYLPAICGAVMFCRKKALHSTMLRGGEVMDSLFYMYKEDIDLSLRLRKRGWKLAYCPSLCAYHCRGWNPDRKKMPRYVRLLSAKNELRIHLRAFSPLGILYSMVKYASVKLLNV